MHTHLADAVAQRVPVLWINPERTASTDRRASAWMAWSLVEEAEARLRRFAPLLAMLFPELAPSGGVIESDLLDVPALAPVLLGGEAAGRGRLMLKADHDLPVAGSIKARGGIHEVLEVAERIALAAGLVAGTTDDYRRLASPQARALFARHTVAVGSTGNLGLSIGTMSAALGLRAVVHMSAEAKAWKRSRLRSRGVEVVEHPGDYAEAVAAGRRGSLVDPRAHFVDDERSPALFAGYATAAFRLAAQLAAQGVLVDAEHPLFVHLPCGVGGAPGGIAYGLRHVLGTHVHCFFAEPVESPCFLVQMLHPERPGMSVRDIGLTNRTEADGLAVPTASQPAVAEMRTVLSGIFTVRDRSLLEHLAMLHAVTGLRIEPSAAAGFDGPSRLTTTPAGRAYLARAGLDERLGSATHLLWTTGGKFVPDDEFDRHLRVAAQAGQAAAS